MSGLRVWFALVVVLEAVLWTAALVGLFAGLCWLSERLWRLWDGRALRQIGRK